MNDICFFFLHFVEKLPDKTCHKNETTLYCKIENLNPTDNGKSREESHSSSDCRTFCFKGGLLIFGDPVKVWNCEEDFDIAEFCVSFKSLEQIFIPNCLNFVCKYLQFLRRIFSLF